MGSINETADHSNFVRDIGFTIGIDGHIQKV